MLFVINSILVSCHIHFLTYLFISLNLGSHIKLLVCYSMSLSYNGWPVYFKTLVYIILRVSHLLVRYVPCPIAIYTPKFEFLTLAWPCSLLRITFLLPPLIEMTDNKNTHIINMRALATVNKNYSTLNSMLKKGWVTVSTKYNRIQ